MSAGLPGVGLGGFFVLMTALAMPFFAARRRPRTGPERVRPWGMFLMALALLVLTVAVWETISLVMAPTDRQRAFPPGAGLWIPLVLILVVFLVGEAQLRLGGRRPTPKLPPIPFAGDDHRDE
jgi:hypothetical protein